MGAARAHLRYIQRDGVQRDGSPGLLYSADAEQCEGREFIERCLGDRHQFRLIVSAEDGDLYDDLQPLVRRLMARMEKDLGTRLEWAAVDHIDTGHPHSHVILRGKDDQGANLVIAREYIARGMRERLSELLTQDLGPRQDHEIRRKLRLEVSAERFTSIDRSLEKEAGTDRMVRCSIRDPFRHALRARRLKKLDALGLAEPVGSSRWKLAPDFRQQLMAMSERRDIVRTMQRALTASGIERAPADQVVHQHVPERGLVGRVLERGLADELSGRQYLIVDAVDGRVHRIDLGTDRIEPVPHQAIVRISARRPRSNDRERRPAAKVEILSPLPIDSLPRHDGATWLDDQLGSENPELCREAGFGKQVRAALAIRREWLREQELATNDQGGFALAPGALGVLRRREIANAAARLSKKLGLDFASIVDGEPVHGTLARRIDLASGRFAIVEDGRQFSLVPWKPVLEPYLGRQVEGLARGGNVSWTLSRTRSLDL
jgi:type IV secretory pathway VirD2 relaxase